MGTDYSPVGGVGIKLTTKQIYYIIENNPNEEDCIQEALDDLEVDYETAGCSRSGSRLAYYLLVKGDTLQEVIENLDEFIIGVNKLGLKVSKKDIKIIQDLLIW